MAINFLNNVNFNSIQVQDIVIENFTTAAAGAGVLGQMYFDTTLDTMMQFVANDGTGNAGYIEIGTTSGVETLTTTQAGNSTGNTLTVLTSAIGNVTINSFAYAGGSNIGYVPSGGTANKYLDGTGNWVDVTTGDIESVNAATASNLLGIDITTPLGPNPTVGLDIVGRDSLGGTAAAGDELLIYDLDTTKNKKVTVENLVGGYETTYTLPVVSIAGNNARISLTQNNATVDSTVTLIGTAGRIALSSSPNATAGTITVDFPDDVIIVDDLTVGGELVVSGTGTSSFAGPVSLTGSKLTNVGTGIAGTDGVNLGQVELLIAGVGVFQGSYNAATNTPALEGGSNVKLDQGDYFVVSVAGTFLGEALEPGDFIFANNAIAANSSPALSNYTVVQADDNVAGAGATDGATQKGVAGFDSANFNVSSNGWVQIKPLSRLNGRKQALNNTSPVTRTFLNNLTTFVIDLADASLFGTGALAEDVTVEVMQNASPFQTVYADVVRSGSASMSVIFVGNVAVDAYRVLLEYI